MHKVSCLLRTNRMKLGFTQQDVSALVPRTGHNRVSYVERNKRPPNAREILAYRLIFDTLPEGVFPGLVSDVEEAVARGAYRLHQKYARDSSPVAKRKCATLREIHARAAKSARTPSR
jgi:transcriptional regulator with XRE-family HTH domain